MNPAVSGRDGERHLTRSSVWLVGAAAAANLLGFAFWLVAARRSDTAAVGAATAATATMSLTALLTGAGVTQTLLRRLPGSGDRAARLIRTSYRWGAGAPVALTLALLLATGQAGATGALLLTCLGAGITGACLISDAVAVAGRAAGRVAERNVLNGTLRTATLLLLVPLTTGSVGILTAWVAALATSTAWQIHRLRPVVGELGATAPTISGDTHETGWHHAGVLGLQLPSLALPVVIERSLGAADAGRFYIAWYIGAALFMLAPQIANVLLSESSRQGGDTAGLLARGIRLHALLAVPAVATVVVAGVRILEIFGEDYRAASTLLTLLALSSAPVAVNAFTASVWRTRHRFAAAALVQLVPGAGTLLAGALLPVIGADTTTLGWTWLLLSSACAVSALPTLLTTLRGGAADRDA